MLQQAHPDWKGISCGKGGVVNLAGAQTVYYDCFWNNDAGIGSFAVAHGGLFNVTNRVDGL